LSTPFVDMMDSALEPPTTSDGTGGSSEPPTPAPPTPAPPTPAPLVLEPSPAHNASTRDADVATGRPPALPLLSGPTVVVASQGPVPAIAALPATGGATEVPLGSASLLIVIGFALATVARRRETRRC